MKALAACAILFVACSCTSLRKTTVHELDDGYYRVMGKEQAGRKMYLQVSDDSLFLFNLPLKTGQYPVQTISLSRYPQDSLKRPLLLLYNSLDIDLTTILLKYRFRRPALPGQLNSNFNAALYLGYRRDYFRFRDRRDALGNRQREIHHFAVDFGPFAGIGATAINPSTTHDRVAEEYDGVVLQKGIAVFIGSSRFSIGIGLGFDGLLNRHRQYWIYQERPYIGLLIGLNLSN
jgi:hypothetical protein